jgi:hypothetical protein
MESMKFLKEFAEKRRKLNKVITFQPHYAVFGIEGNSPSVSNQLCSDSTGQYCAEDPDGAGPVTGKDVLEENVRQLCIHDLYKVNPDGASSRVRYSEEFWDYMEHFMVNCPLSGSDPQNRFGLECSVKTMKLAGVSVDRVNSCVLQNRAAFLKRERENQAWSPRALRINGWRYSGILDADLVTKAICSGLSNMPAICTDLTKPRNPFQPYYKTEGLTFSQLVIYFLAMCGVMLVLMLMYKRYLKKEMRATLREEVMLEVQAQMGEYTKMHGNG